MKKRFIMFFCFLLGLSVLFSSCTDQNSSPAPKDKKVLNVSLGGSTRNLDPAYAVNIEDGSLILHLFEGLFVMGDDGRPVMGQAEHYEVDETNLIYTFKLKDNLLWSNGDDLGSEDFAYAWNRATSIFYNTRADLFRVIAKNDDGSLKLETPDSQTLIVHLNRYTPYFEELLCLPVFCPVYKKMVEYDAEKWSINPEACVGNGAFALGEYREDSHISLEKNENYSGVDRVKIEKLNFIMLDATSAYESYLDGELLFIDRVPNLKLAEASEKKGYNNRLSNGLYYLVFNKNLEPLKDERVRQALVLAIDRDHIAREICRGAGSPAGAIVPPLASLGNDGPYYREVYGNFIESFEYEENLEKAKNLLKEADFLTEGTERPAISYQHNLGTEHALIADSIAQMWSEIGVSLNIEPNQWELTLLNAESQSFQILRSGWMTEWKEPGAILENFRTGNPFNVIKYSNNDYDDYIDRALSEQDAEKRADLFYKAEKLLFEDYIICPLFYYSDIYMQSEYLQGVIKSPYEYTSFVYAQISK